MLRKAVLYFLIVILSCAFAQAQVFIPEPGKPIQSLSPWLKAFVDHGGKYPFDLIVSREYSRFRSIDSVEKVSGHAALWVKLEMLPAFTSDKFYIGLPQQNLPGISHGNDVAEVWIVKDSQVVQHFKTGNLTPVSKRPVANPVNCNLFPISLEANEPVTVYWKLKQTINVEPLQFNFAMQHKDVVAIKPLTLDSLVPFYIGFMFVLFAMGLIFLIITKERSFLWFCVLSAVFCLHMQLLDPHSSWVRWFFPQSPQLQYYLFTILTNLSGVFILQFIRSFTRTKLLLPKWDKVIRALMAYTAIVMAISMLAIYVSPFLQFIFQLQYLTFIGSIVIAIRLITFNNIYCRWTGLALLWLFFFQVFGIMWNINLLPDWVPNPWAIAQLGMMIILFFGLAYRFRESAREKAEAGKVLEMDAIKNRFFANISHEFRTPLTLMLGRLKQLEGNGMEDKQQKKHIGSIRRNGDRLLQLINQLLDLSKLESGKMELQVAKTDITALLKTIATSFDSLAEEKQISYNIHLPENTIIGFIDRDKLEKVVVNLLSNAFRFTEPGGLVSFSVEEDKKRLRLTIQDNGKGIPKEQLDKIFDRFHQVGGTQGGTGIGLSLVKELLQLHKSQVSVQSEAGRGSSFKVSIPIAAEFYEQTEMTSVSIITEAETDSDELIVDEEDNASPSDSSLPLVLIVEDNIELQEYIGDVLKPNFQVVIAGNGKLGLKKAIESVPDCIISDIMMPEMDGIELCEKLKNEHATSHIPVILLTAKASKNSRIEGLQTGADDYLVKPFDATELIVRVQNLIEQRKQLRDRFSQQVINIKPEELPVQSSEKDFISRIRAVIEENIDNESFGVNEIAGAIHLSRSQLHRKLKALTGLGPNELIRNYRLERGLQLLQQGNATVTEVAYQTGFSSPAYFSKCFSDRYGYPPGEIKKKI